jgi:hypothetical protein
MAEKSLYLAHSNENIQKIGSAGFGSGGGDGSGGDMEARLKALEDKIDAKLTSIASDLAIMKVKFENLATKDDLSKLSERVGKVETAVSMLPGTLQLMGFVLAVLAIAGLAKYFAP